MGFPNTDTLDTATPDEHTCDSARHKPRPRMNSLTVRILRTVPELEEFREIWTLWCDDPNADIDYYLAVS